MASYQMLIGINLLICGYIFWICLYRLGVSSPDVHPYVRGYYTLLLTGAVAYGLQAPLFGYIPTPAGVFFALCVMVGLLMSRERWSQGAPDEVLKATVTRPNTVGQ